MRKDKDAQLTVRGLCDLKVRDHKRLVKWLKFVIKEVEDRQLNYAPIARWSLMKD